MPEILPEIFSRSLSLETGGDRSGKDPIALWERMAHRLDEIAANTKRGFSAGGGMGKLRSSVRGYPVEDPAGSRTATTTSAGRRKAAAGRSAGRLPDASGSQSGRAKGREPYIGAKAGERVRGLGPIVAASDTRTRRAESRAQVAQSRYQQRTDRESSARDSASLEIASDSFALQRDEARQEQKRHKELVKAVKAASPGLFGKVGNQLLGGRARGKDGRFVAQGGRTAARGGILRSAGGGLLRGAGALLRKAGPLALMFAGMDAIAGANSAELHREAFGLKEGQTASTGQRLAAGAASALDMGGLLTGAANLFGLDINTADLARGLYDTATAVGDFFKQLNPETLLAGAKTVMANAIDIGKRAFDGVTDFVEGLDLPGKASALVGAVGDLGSRALASISDFFGSIDVAGTLKEAATGAWDTVKSGAGKLADGFMSLFSGDDDKEKTPAKETGKAAAERKLAQEVAQKEAESGIKSGLAMPVADTGESMPVELSPADKQAIAGPLASTVETSSLLSESLEALTAILTKDYQLREREYRLNMMLNPEAAAMLGLTDALKGFSMGGGGSYGGGASGGGGGGSSSAPGVKYDPNAKLGSYFAKYESGNKGVDAIGYDSGGGTSYGKYQFASATGGMEGLLSYMESQGGEAADAARRIRAAGPLNTGGRGGAAVDAYNAEIARNREMMERVQDEFAFKQYYVGALSGLDGDFQKRIEGNRALQEVLFSSSIQHGQGGARKIFRKALEQNPNASDEDLIRAVFQIRSGYLGKLNANEQSGVLNRYRDEEAMAIQLSQSQRRVEAFQRAAASGGLEGLYAQQSMAIQGLTEDAMRRNVGYLLGGKNSFSGKGIDCSGWVAEMNLTYMDAINKAMGETVYDAEAFKVMRQGAGGGAAGLIQAIYKATGQMLTTDEINSETVKEGMFLGLDTGGTNGRFMNIDHIAQTFRDKKTGQMMVSESRGGKGVTVTSYEEWEARYKKRGAKMFAVDPTMLADASKLPAKEAATEAAQVAVAEATEAQAESVQAQTAQAIAMERAETVAPPPMVEEVGQIAPPTQTGNRQLDLARVEGLLADILKALQSGFTKMQRPVEMAGGAGPNFAMDFDDAAAREVANS